MTAQKKTDNHDPRAKLNLRRYFLEKYHRDGAARVLDCCMGSGWIWRELRREWRVAEYLGLDVKPKKGRLKIDSARYLEAGGWSHDVIDIDTYGSPWRHWFALLPFVKGQCSVFLTIGQNRMVGGFQGDVPKELACALGIPKQTPASIAAQLWEIGGRFCLASCTDYGVTIEEVIEAETQGNARYVGIRLNKLEPASSV